MKAKPKTTVVDRRIARLKRELKESHANRREVCDEWSQAIENVANLTRLLSESDKKRHELFEECTGLQRMLEDHRRFRDRLSDDKRKADEEVERLLADNRMYFSLLKSERERRDRERSMDIGAVASTLSAYMDHAMVTKGAK